MARLRTLVISILVFLLLLDGMEAFGGTTPATDMAIPAIGNGSWYAMAGQVLFEENKGQAPAKYGFLSHQGNVTALFSRDGLDLVLGGADQQFATVGLRLLGTQPDSSLRAEQRLPSVSNYFVGNDPKRWLRHVPQDAEVVLKSIQVSIWLFTDERSSLSTISESLWEQIRDRFASQWKERTRLR